MSSGSSYPRCEIDPGSSRSLFFYSALLILLAVAAPWFTALPAVYALLASLPVLVAVPVLFRWARGMLTKIVWHGDGRWVLVGRNGAVHEECHLLPGICVSARVLMLRWQCNDCGNVFRTALLADNCDEEQRRRLVVRLNVTQDDELFRDQSPVAFPGGMFQWIGKVLPAKFAGTSTVLRGGCSAPRSG